jgi:hypothetical protein
MCYIASIAIVLAIGLFVVAMCAVVYAAVYDWCYRRRYGAWIELERDHTKPRRPAAK